MLAVKDIQSLLSESIREFFEALVSDPQSTPHSVQETIEKIMGGLRHVSVTHFPGEVFGQTRAMA